LVIGAELKARLAFGLLSRETAAFQNVGAFR
jgi:hypothetical protein